MWPTRVTEPEFALPATKSKLAKLGARLVAKTASADDWELYGAVLDVYDRAQVHARNRLDQVDWREVLGHDLDLAVSGRAKTLDTLTQKLERTPAIKLPYIRDIAGVRIVGNLTLSEQDLVADHCKVLFNCPDAQVVDRRTDPEAGYRALHVVVNVGQLVVEVQIRTRFQALWANLFERVADTWGRQIRYGQDPDLVGDEPQVGEEFRSRNDVVAALQALSLIRIREVEELVDLSAMIEGLVTSPPLSLLRPDERVPSEIRPSIEGVETYGDLVDRFDSLKTRVAESRSRLERSLLRIADVIESIPPNAATRNTLGDVEQGS